jgi:hypothetical protein
MHAQIQDHPDELQRAYAVATPAARLRAIRQRLASVHGEMATTRLVTLVAAVEALARSLVVHSFGRPTSTAEMRHRQFRDLGPRELAEEVLRLRGAARAAQHFEGDTWSLFEAAVQYRDLIVHECTFIGPHHSAQLIVAAESVLRGLIALAGLEGGPRTVS